jgi:hypothetical protein
MVRDTECFDIFALHVLGDKKVICTDNMFWIGFNPDNRSEIQFMIANADIHLVFI